MLLFQNYHFLASTIAVLALIFKAPALIFAEAQKRNLLHTNLLHRKMQSYDS